MWGSGTTIGLALYVQALRVAALVSVRNGHCRPALPLRNGCRRLYVFFFFFFGRRGRACGTASRVRERHSGVSQEEGGLVHGTAARRAPTTTCKVRHRAAASHSLRKPNASGSPPNSVSHTSEAVTGHSLRGTLNVLFP